MCKHDISVNFRKNQYLLVNNVKIIPQLRYCKTIAIGKYKVFELSKQRNK